MIGAIIGDIAGSVYEWHNIKTKDFPLFDPNSHFTDDSVMTLAVAEGLMNGGSRDALIDAMKKYGRMYPGAGYGGRFMAWLRSDTRAAYGSWGNGSAMRVSPVGWLPSCSDYATTGQLPTSLHQLAERTAAVTHDHPEGIRGAKAVADAIYLCRVYSSRVSHPGTDSPLIPDLASCKALVREHIEWAHGYDLSRSLDQIRPTYQFDVSCQGSVPEAIIAFLESTSFEDTIRNAISLGGDSDTIAAMAGSIAEAAYGVPTDLETEALDRLTSPLLDVIHRWRSFLAEQPLR